VRPDKLFGNATFWDFSKLIEKWTFFKVNVQTVSKATVRLANERVWLNPKRKQWFAPTLSKTAEGGMSHFLCKSERQVRLFDLSLLFKEFI
jgi:hypothetical protein